MDLSTFDEVAQFSQGSLAIDPASLYRELEKVRDGRGKKGVRFPLPFVLTLIILGKMAGQKKISGIIAWVKEREVPLRKLLNWPKDFPVHSTYDDVLAKCNEQDLIEVIESVIRKARAADKYDDEKRQLSAEAPEEEKLVHRAVDGKVMRGTLKHANENQPPVHLVGLYECETGILVAQIEVRTKENEISVGKILLNPLYVKGRVTPCLVLGSGVKKYICIWDII